jgi:hypothetical protein
MFRWMIIVSLLLGFSCSKERSKTALLPTPTLHPANECVLQFKQTCLIPGDAKCLAYDTQETSQCKEGK